MKTHFILALVLLLSAGKATQGMPLPPAPDSLRAAVQQATPGSVAQARAWLRVAQAFTDPPQPAALAYAQAAQRLARQLGDKPLQGQALDAQGAYYWTSREFARALPLLQQAEQLLAPAPAADRYRNLYHLAVVSTDLRHQRPALRYYRRAYALTADLGADSTAQRAEIINSLGVFYLSYERPDSAAYYLFRAVRRQHALGRREAEAATLLNLAAVFFLREQHAAAARYARQALSLQRALRDSVGQIEALNALASITQQNHDSLRQALRYYQAEATLLRRFPIAGSQADLTTNMALLYSGLGQTDSAEAGFRRTLRLRYAAGEGNEATSIITRLHLAELLLKQNHRLAEAQQLAESALALARKFGQPADEQQALRALAQLAARRSDYRQALSLTQRERTLADSLTLLDNRRLTAELRAQYETEQAEQRVQALEKDRELASLRLQRTAAGLVAALLLAAGTAIGGIALYRRRQRERDARLRTQLAADLHDEVGGLLTRVALQAELLTALAPAETGGSQASVTAEPLRHLLLDSRQAAATMRDVVWSIDARADSAGALLDRMHDALDSTARAAGWSRADFLVEGSLPDPLPPLLRQNVYLIFKEALTNAARHAPADFAGPEARLRCHGSLLELEILSECAGTCEPARPSTGLGLRNMQQRAQALGGQLEAGPAADRSQWRVSLRVPL